LIEYNLFTPKIDKFFKNNKYLFACFVDLKKALDTVNRQALLFKLNRYNIRGHFLNIIEDMYNDVSFSIMLANGITQPFQTSIGVKQGCVLSPTFFSVYMNDFVEHFNLECDPWEIYILFVICR
jgi:hypothetical protein